MKEFCPSISRLLEKYFDQEVTAEERSLVEAHLPGCPSCQEGLKTMEGLRHLIKAPVDEADRKENFRWVWQRIEREIQQEERLTWKESIKRWLDLTPILRKRVWIPAAAAIATLLLIITPYFYREAPSSSELSVVEYVESQTHNVMIYESEKGNVTVIWLLEAPAMEGVSPS
jgi:hypothetical protein